MSNQKPVYKRYSEAFKRQVVAEYEAGASANSLSKTYGIGRVDTITRWVKQYGSAGLRHQVMHIQTPEEANRVQQLEQRCAMLERVIAELTVRTLVLEGQLQVYQETYGSDVLKKNGH